MFKKPLSLIVSILFIILLSFVIIDKPNAPKEVTFAPFFQILGKFVQTADASISRILAVGEWDEAKFGEELKKEFKREYEESIDSIYLNELAEQLLTRSRKDFPYKVYVDPYMAPNAYAMPGGVIVFSAELLDLLENEAQVASILAHEIAHIELDHCLNAFKFELAKDEYNLKVPDLFSALCNVLIGLSFSKSQEDEADEYAFNLIAKDTEYWPASLSNSFQLFLEAYGKDDNREVLSEFFQSHPDMAYRRNKYYERAQTLSNIGERYMGYSNLQMRETLTNVEIEEEWKLF